jgi:Xaa-Pro aminopeptidase
MLTSLSEQLPMLIDRYGINTVFIETSYATIDELQLYTKILPNCTISTENTLDQAVLIQRSIKTENEIKRIKEAQRITDDTFGYIVHRIHPGMTEREIMLEMEFYLRRQGSEGIAFDFIVVSGKNSSLPHGVPTNKVIQKGDFITMDFGAVFDGYRSDMTRTVCLGAATEEQRLVYNTVLKAQQLALDAIKPNTVCKEIDGIARDFIDRSGYGGKFGHGLGHSVGIEIHENPSFNTRDTTVLKPGMILTVEPGIYLPEKFGVRIEDMVLITDIGYENLTHSTKELLEI